MSIDYNPKDTRTHEEYVNTPKGDAGSIFDEESADDRLNAVLADIAGFHIVSETTFKGAFPKVVK